MRVLVACEESQTVTIELRKLGHTAFSCDILPCSGGYPEWHIQDDVAKVLNGHNFMRKQWDMILAFPPCTHLAASGARWFAQKQADGRQQEAIDFFMSFANAACPRIAIENPIGIMSKLFRKPDQIIEPFMFGDPVKKKTCLWLINLPKLIPTDIVSCAAKDKVFSSGKIMSDWYYKTSCLPHDQRSFARSKTFPGIAKAMAKQWT